MREFVISNFLFGEASGQLGDEESFIAKGILDSTGVMELAHFVEETYGFQIRDDELVPENLDSISSIVRYVTSKLAGRPG